MNTSEKSFTVYITDGPYAGGSHSVESLWDLYTGEDKDWDMFWAFLDWAPQEEILELLRQFLNQHPIESRRSDEDGSWWHADRGIYYAAHTFFRSVYKRLSE